MSTPVIIAEKNQIKPAKRRELENAGYIVITVADIEKVKAIGTPMTAANHHEDDGFNLDAESA